MKRWQLAALSVILILVFGIGASSAATTWRVCFNTMIQQNNWYGKIFEDWAKEIADRTKGELKIQIYWPGQLPYKGFEILATVKDRLVDAAECNTSYYGTTEPLMDEDFKRFQFDEIPWFEKASEKVIPKYYQPIFDKYNVIPIAKFLSGGGEGFFANKPVTKVADCKGMKVRVYSKSTADMVKAWGGNPVTIPVVELYTALQRGVVDGAVTSFMTASDAKFWEVLKYVTWTNHNVGGYDTIITNKTTWNALPDNVKKIVMEVSNKHSDRVWKGAPKITQELMEDFKKRGVKILYLEPAERNKFKALCAFQWKEWLDRTGPTGVAMLREIQTLGDVTWPILKDYK